MPLVTGSGCMLSALCGAFAAVEDDAFAAACAASSVWKRCSELAEQLSGRRGPAAPSDAALMDAACPAAQLGHLNVPEHRAAGCEASGGGFARDC